MKFRGMDQLLVKPPPLISGWKGIITIPKICLAPFQTPKHPPKPFKLTSSLELLEPFRTVQNIKKTVPNLKSFQIRREA